MAFAVGALYVYVCPCESQPELLEEQIFVWAILSVEHRTASGVRSIIKRAQLLYSSRTESAAVLTLLCDRFCDFLVNK